MNCWGFKLFIYSLILFGFWYHDLVVEQMDVRYILLKKKNSKKYFLQFKNKE